MIDGHRQNAVSIPEPIPECGGVLAFDLHVGNATCESGLEARVDSDPLVLQEAFGPGIPEVYQALGLALGTDPLMEYNRWLPRLS